MRVLFIPRRKRSEPLWGGDFFLAAAMKHSEHEVVPHYGFDGLGVGQEGSHWENSDIIHVHNLAAAAVDRGRFGFKSRIKEYSKLKERPIIIGGIRGNQGFNKAKAFLKYFDIVHVSNRSLLNRVCKYNHNVFLLYPGVDVSLFRPMLELRPRHFTVGWAGDSDKTMKNSHLLPKLGYSYKVATKRNYVPHGEMPFFYNSLSAYAHFSSHEGCNRTIIEAMACGLPVVSTAAGVASRVLHRALVVDGVDLRGFIGRLRVLHDDPALRVRVGAVNRRRVQEFAWERVIEKLDEMWSHVHALRSYVLP